MTPNTQGDSLERFDPAHDESGSNPWALGNDPIVMEPWEDGKWVSYSDHLAALEAEREQRLLDAARMQREIEEAAGSAEKEATALREALEDLIAHSRLIEKDYDIELREEDDSCNCSPCEFVRSIDRAALSTQHPSDQQGGDASEPGNPDNTPVTGGGPEVAPAPETSDQQESVGGAEK